MAFRIKPAAPSPDPGAPFLVIVGVIAFVFKFWVCVILYVESKDDVCMETSLSY